MGCVCPNIVFELLLPFSLVDYSGPHWLLWARFDSCAVIRPVWDHNGPIVGQCQQSWDTCLQPVFWGCKWHKTSRQSVYIILRGSHWWMGSATRSRCLIPDHLLKLIHWLAGHFALQNVHQLGQQTAVCDYHPLSPEQESLWSVTVAAMIDFRIKCDRICSWLFRWGKSVRECRGRVNGVSKVCGECVHSHRHQAILAGLGLEKWHLSTLLFLEKFLFPPTHILRFIDKPPSCVSPGIF